jgi:phage terminase large subunit-like protein
VTKRKIRLDRPAGCRFDEQAARRAVRFFREELRHTKGRRHAGKPFGLTSEQEHDLREIFGRMDADGNRLIRQVFKAVPKKNGKSEEAAAVANKLLFADDEPGAEVYGAAADITQAGIVFGVAASMVRHNPKLLRRSKIWDSTKRIVVPGSESYYRAVTSKVAGKHVSGAERRGHLWQRRKGPRRHWLTAAKMPAGMVRSL